MVKGPLGSIVTFLYSRIWNICTVLTKKICTLYKYMSWYYLWENLCKIGSSKDCLTNFFLFACWLQRNQLKGKLKTLQQYFTLRVMSPSDKNYVKHQKLSTGGWSLDFNVSSQEVKLSLVDRAAMSYLAGILLDILVPHSWIKVVLHWCHRYFFGVKVMRWTRHDVFIDKIHSRKATKIGKNLVQEASPLKIMRVSQPANGRFIL